MPRFPSLTIAALLAVAPPAHGLDLNGSKLDNLCDREEIACGSYIMGAIDTLRMSQQITAEEQFCLPVDFDDNAATQTVRKYLEEHSAVWHQIAPKLIAEALNKSYPGP